jgi:hypothetical protein
MKKKSDPYLVDQAGLGRVAEKVREREARLPGLKG